MRDIYKVSLLGVWLLGVSLGAQEPKQPSAAELSKNETPGKALTRSMEYQEYEFRSAAEAMPTDKWNYRPAQGLFKNEKPEFGPAEMRTFAEQVKHVACSNFAFAAELDGTKPPEGCDKGGPNPAKTPVELLNYLRDSFGALKKSLAAVTAQNMLTRLKGHTLDRIPAWVSASSQFWHVADHYGQVVIYLRENGIVPPASQSHPPQLKDKY